MDTGFVCQVHVFDVHKTLLNLNCRCSPFTKLQFAIKNCKCQDDNPKATRCLCEVLNIKFSYNAPGLTT